MPHAPDADAGTVRWGRGYVRHARVPEWVLDADISDRAVRLYAVLGRYADENGSSQIRKSKLCTRLRCSRPTLDAALRDLTQVGAVEALEHFHDDGGRAANEYVLHWAKPVSFPTSESELAEGSESELGGSRAGDPREPFESKLLSKDPDGSSTAIAVDDRSIVRDTWLAQSPPLVAHRDSYFSETKTGKAIRKALDRYGTDDVLLAISAYATVLESPDYYWTHRWTLLDFLNRGLDKFVPEARPLDNYRTEKKTDRRGDEVMSIADMQRRVLETSRREQEALNDPNRS